MLRQGKKQTVRVGFFETIEIVDEGKKKMAPQFRLFTASARSPRLLWR